jgi:hypothetical protein
MSTNDPIVKLCTGCRRDRPVGRFLYSQFTADGLTDRCLDCISAEATANRQQREMRRAAEQTVQSKRPVKRTRTRRQEVPATYA